MGPSNTHRRYGKKIVGGAVILLMVVVFAYAGWRFNTPTSSSFSNTSCAFSLVSSLLASPPSTLGSANASVTIVELGLNMTQFNQDFSGKYDALVNSNHSLGVQADISETPTFFLIGPNDKVDNNSRWSARIGF